MNRSKLLFCIDQNHPFWLFVRVVFRYQTTIMQVDPEIALAEAEIKKSNATVIFKLVLLLY
jgi:hypothetical protein